MGIGGREYSSLCYLKEHFSINYHYYGMLAANPSLDSDLHPFVAASTGPRWLDIFRTRILLSSDYTADRALELINRGYLSRSWLSHRENHHRLFCTVYRLTIFKIPRSHRQNLKNQYLQNLTNQYFGFEMILAAYSGLTADDP